MLSLTAVNAIPTKSKATHVSSPFLPLNPLQFQFQQFQFHRNKTAVSKPISATIIPSSSPNPSQKLYQPFRPPPSPIPPQFRSLDTNGRFEILANRLGLWFEYAPLIPSLIQEGFSPPTIEEITGISGVEQNRLVVAAQVRETLVQSSAEPDTIDFFDKGGAELLYEIRLLSASQRAAAARYLLDNNLDAKGAQELARAMKDFPRRRGDRGWECFDYTLPADCVSFMYYRQALEYHVETEQRRSALERALELVGSERAKKWVSKELEDKDGQGGEAKIAVEGVKVPVVRLSLGEVAEATIVVVLPVAEEEEELEEAPWECGCQGEFGVVVAEKGWRKWVVLPAWHPGAGLKSGGVAVSFLDTRALPWKVNRWYKEEAILVVADRGRKEVTADNGFYLVDNKKNKEKNELNLKVERGLTC